MTIDLSTLKPGDVIRHKRRSEAVIVTANYGDRVTAVRAYDVTNPCEWDLVSKATAR